MAPMDTSTLPVEPVANTDDLFYIDVISANADVRSFLMGKVQEMLGDPSIDAAIDRILEGSGTTVESE